MSDVCYLPAVSGGAAGDWYTGLGGTVQTTGGFNPATGQGSLALDVGVGAGWGVTGRLVESASMSVSPSGGPRPIVDLGINLNATGAIGGFGGTGSYELMGSNPGNWTVGATQAAGATINANISMHGQINTPALWDARCEQD